MSRYRDPQLQVGENICQFEIKHLPILINTHFIPNNSDLGG